VAASFLFRDEVVQHRNRSHPSAEFRAALNSLVRFEGARDDPQNFLENLGPSHLAFVQRRYRTLIEFSGKRFHSLFKVATHTEQDTHSANSLK
jgi:hypothetical protein